MKTASVPSSRAPSYRCLVASSALVVAALLAAPGPAAAKDWLDPVVSTQEMLSRIEQPWVQLIDVRSPDEYAGRDIRALRGGHIPGAISLPASEGDEPGPVAGDLRSRVEALDRRKETIVYGHDAAAAQRVADWLRAQGFRQVRVYAGAWQVWGNSLELPVAGERYADVGALRDRLVSLERELARRSPRAALSEAGASRPETLSASR
ncbi:sulfurtransferase [Zeimonas arvi]|uniref:Rhodanese domain-containing protein n=1 Tax=Zeimonas arvi TaxID=2498847 RepID=A0A5C8NTL5_9BURK|nr:rhodanese-like domain-containing protein [Zeimonas arvi]TXL64326.1 hypothetical protein FHP08_15475 [Zeimonas arvi]